MRAAHELAKRWAPRCYRGSGQEDGDSHHDDEHSERDDGGYVCLTDDEEWGFWR